MLQNAYLDATIGVDPAENEPSEMVIFSPDTGVSILIARSRRVAAHAGDRRGAGASS